MCPAIKPISAEEEIDSFLSPCYLHVNDCKETELNSNSAF